MSERENINSEMLEEIERLRKELEKEKSLRIASENNQKIIQEHLSLTQEKLDESLEKNQNLISKVAKIEKERDWALSKIEGDERFVNGILFLLKNGLDNKLIIEEEIIDRYITNSDGAANEALKALKDYAVKVLELAQTNDKLKGLLFHQGNEKITIESAEKTVKEDVQKLVGETKVDRSMKSMEKGVSRVINTLTQLAPVVTPEQRAKLLEIDALIKSADKARRLEKSGLDKTTHSGKVNNKHRLKKAAYRPKDKSNPKSCSACHSEELENMGQKVEELKTALSTVFHNALDAICETHAHNIFRCTKCGRYIYMTGPGEDHPVLPSREVSTNTLIGFSYMMYMGLPIERASSFFEKKALLGSDTINVSLHDYARVYLAPLYHGLVSKIKEQEIIYADETPWNCLQDQGRGKLPAGTEEKPKRSTNYILSVSSVADAKEKIHLFNYLPTRSAKSMSDFLDKDFKFKVLVTDGYQSYENIMKEHPGAAHQSCLVHFRRALLDALRIDAQVAESEELSGAQLKKILEEKMMSQTKVEDLYEIYTALASIFSWEPRKKKAPLGSRRRKQAHKAQKMAFDIIRRNIHELSQDRTIQKGSKWTTRKGDYISKCCAYFLNHEEQLGYFTTDDRVPIDTNPVERLIRTIACYRKSCWFKHNADYSQDMCMIMSIYATLQANGVKNPIELLQSYSTELYKHMYENLLYLEERNGAVSKNDLLKKRLRIVKKGSGEGAPTLEALREGFDYSVWFDQIFNP